VVKREAKISARVALVSGSGKAEKKKAIPTPSPAVAQDPAKAGPELKARRSANEEELKLEKEQIENAIKNSTGAVRERWKYRLAVWKEKMAAAKQEETALK
jgi:hypothetical protein